MLTMGKNLRLVYITTSNKNEARYIGRILVEEKLAACVNIIDGMESIYAWDGGVEEASETILIAKTRKESIQKLTDRILKLHSYDCPCVISLEINEGEGNPDYLTWLWKEAEH